MQRTCRQCSAPLDLLKPGRIPTYCSTRCRVAGNRAAIPLDLRSRDRWVSWLPSKRPIQLDGSSATSTDPGTWASYSQIRTAERKGFVLGDGIGCFDLDHCLDGSILTPAAAAFLARMPATYTEISPSGTGLHLWYRMPEAPGSRRRVDGLSIETYSRARYITVTGKRFAGSMSTLAELPRC